MQDCRESRATTPPAGDRCAAPNFVLGGAPKCGTTAMGAYLRDHPAVWFSDPKEPFYWATDLPGLRRREAMESPADYARLFGGAGPRHTAVGEGSTLYLYSEHAIANILRELPATKFIFMLRRPWEIAHAFHMQMRFNFYEDIDDFERAWRAQGERARGDGVPDRCVDAGLLQYRAVAGIGGQIERAANLIPAENLLVLLFDDFRRDPGAAYREALAFLGLDDDQRADFPRANSAMRPRAAWLTDVMRSGPVNRLTRGLKATLPGGARDLADRTKKWLLKKPARREALSPGFQRELIEAFRPEVTLVEQTLGRDLADWK